MKSLYTLLLTICVGVTAFMNTDVFAQNQDQKRFSNQFESKTAVAYPMPANSNVFVKLSPALKAEAKSIEVINLIGKAVAQQEVSNSNGDVNITNLQNVPEGIYMIVIKDGNDKLLYSTKLLVSH